MVSRVTDEIGGFVVELGTDGGLLAAPARRADGGQQPGALAVPAGLRAGRARRQHARAGPSKNDRLAQPEPGTGAGAGQCADRLAGLSADELLDMQAVAAAVPAPAWPTTSTSRSVPAATGSSAGSPGPPVTAITSIVGSVRRPAEDPFRQRAGPARETPGVDAGLASRVREGLSRLAESAARAVRGTPDPDRPGPDDEGHVPGADVERARRLAGADHVDAELREPGTGVGRLAGQQAEHDVAAGAGPRPRAGPDGGAGI